MYYEITPVTKPRMTRRDSAGSKQNRIQGMRPCVARYFNFKNQVRAANVTLKAGAAIVFYLPMPKSWSKKKKNMMKWEPHLQTPDLSNLLKAIEDAVCDNDSHLWHYRSIQKIWDYEGGISII